MFSNYDTEMNIKNKLIGILYNSPLEVSINMKLRYAPVAARLKKLRMQNKSLKVLEVKCPLKELVLRDYLL